MIVYGFKGSGVQGLLEMEIKRFEDIEACQLAGECVAIRGFIKKTCGS